MNHFSKKIVCIYTQETKTMEIYTGHLEFLFKKTPLKRMKMGQTAFILYCNQHSVLRVNKTNMNPCRNLFTLHALLRCRRSCRYQRRLIRKIGRRIQRGFIFSLGFLKRLSSLLMTDRLFIN